ncbi:hypothetical protein [Marinobacter sp. F3R08]|uniref:hypothetical protein n=1 Tax=Marinobacter sp. F3R08 TaxID=2841559 RepID=UPI001C09EBA3|nr:hypothetical protein [Marinobacter sp. F3R08]MBU2952222.1 hypothetical protein [Marinobacter sp. F3R08]
MIRLVILFVAVSMLAPVALNSILPERQKNALKHWLVSNDLSFIAGTLLGNGEPTAEQPSDALSAAKQMDYSASFNELKSTVQSATEGFSQGISSDAGQHYFESYVGPGQAHLDSRGPSAEWFPDYQFSDQTKVHSVQETGCVQDKQISMNSGNCSY